MYLVTLLNSLVISSSNFLIVSLGFHRYSIGEGNGTPLQYSGLENPMDGGAWKAAVHGVAMSQTRLSDFAFMHWRRKCQPTPVLWPGKSHERRSLVGYSPWGRRESDTTARLHFLHSLHTLSLEKEMAIHSSILAWRIPWTEEPGGPRSMGSQRVRHD